MIVMFETRFWPWELLGRSFILYNQWTRIWIWPTGMGQGKNLLVVPLLGIGEALAQWSLREGTLYWEANKLFATITVSYVQLAYSPNIAWLCTHRLRKLTKPKKELQDLKHNNYIWTLLTSQEIMTDQNRTLTICACINLIGTACHISACCI